MNLKLTALAKEELFWWMSSLQHSSGKLCIQNHLNQVLIQTDVSKEEWRAVCKGFWTGGLWFKGKELLHINVQGLLAMTLPLLTFTESGSSKSIHFQIDNKTSLSYLLKMDDGGGWEVDSKATVIASSKWICEVLLKKNITISVEYLSSALSEEAGWESRNSRDSSDRKLWPLTFQRIKSRFGYAQIDLFSLRLCHHLENYLSWKLDPHSKELDSV